MKSFTAEDIEQIKVVNYLKKNNIYHFAVINENDMSEKNKTMAAILGRKNYIMGKLAGVSDLVVFTPAKILFIEMKKQHRILDNGQKSKLEMRSKEQINFADNVIVYDYADYAVCYGADEAIDFISQYI